MTLEFKKTKDELPLIKEFGGAPGGVNRYESKYVLLKNGNKYNVAHLWIMHGNIPWNGHKKKIGFFELNEIGVNPHNNSRVTWRSGACVSSFNSWKEWAYLT